MIQFHIQPDSDIPASTQLYNQIHFAIASRQYPPGHRLPSTRQLAMQTGLHRNTISKVYRQLEDDGVVESQAGSGIYVKAPGDESTARLKTPTMEQFPQAHKLIKQNLDELLKQGCSLNQAREMFLAEVDWRLRCSARVLVTSPSEDIGAGELMTSQLEDALKIPVQLVPLEELAQILDQARSGTVVTSHYFSAAAEEIAAPRSVRVIPLDIYDYGQEIQLLVNLPKDSCLGLVSVSTGFLRASAVIVHSLRGENLLVMTAHPNDTFRLNAMVRSAHTIASFDRASCAAVKATVAAAREDLIRPPKLYCCDTYIGDKSINLLKRELGLE
ncbi:GntR family transcriptional regulator [Leptolyngbya sp. 'hensonii']|uniref:GntR family transcriptional regulator n=1 Tax=Leptolyngbya sp. 'hensonii' TaxID=1922337 RepID=UPI00094FC08A|nr:GntR family transcriptional regulator [Leptolyngbya sp. 'hensonii']OLP20167.1 GntR family transcriptional regulator [Leptolyngbya sp. 'hensonii']